MSAFIIFYSTPLNEAKLADYSRQALATVIDHGGAPVVIGPLHSLHDGAPFTRGAAFSFPDRVAAIGWHDSDAYQKLAGLRSEAMRCSIDIIG